MEKILEVKNLAKRFDEKTIHRDISFHLAKGETLALLGHSGTGKSVLLRSLIGLETIDEGAIYYRGKRIDNLSEEELYSIRTQVSYSFQSGALFDSLTVFENIAYPLFEHTDFSEDEITSKVYETLDIINMRSAVDLLPSDLSGGMQKRVGLARSMILHPEILLYDEPTAGLDPVNIDIVLEIMSRFKTQGFSGIFVTHDIPAAMKICDRFIILKDGLISYEGSLQSFSKAEDPFVKQFLGQK